MLDREPPAVGRRRADPAADALQPNDPTGGATHPPRDLGELLTRVPSHVHVLLDESYIHFQDVEQEDAALKLDGGLPEPARVPHLLAARTGSQACRASYVVGSPGAAADMLSTLARCWA